jgi:hypothetical protein
MLKILMLHASLKERKVCALLYCLKYNAVNYGSKKPWFGMIMFVCME